MPSAIATLLTGVALSLPLPAFDVPVTNAPGFTRDELISVLLPVLGASLLVTLLLSLVLVRRQRKQTAAGIERFVLVLLASFIGVSAVATMYGLCLPTPPHTRAYDLPTDGLQIVGPALACVLVGGTLWGTRLANPVGAVLATGVLAALQGVFAELTGGYDHLSLLPLSVGPALVMLGYTPRIREVFSDRHADAKRVRSPGRRYHVVAIVMLVLAGLVGCGFWIGQPLMVGGTSATWRDASLRVLAEIEVSAFVSAIVYLTLLSMDLIACAAWQRAARSSI